MPQNISLNLTGWEMKYACIVTLFHGIESEQGAIDRLFIPNMPCFQVIEACSVIGFGNTVHNTQGSFLGQ